MQWQKSSFSGVEGGNCVEVALAQPRLLLREGDSPGKVLAMAPRGLLALIRHIKSERQRDACACTLDNPTSRGEG
ncbi:DUF397 domain-containing protein [Streptomyces acidicola]|uniref:DUF397 domain-containing protein n=1 Tax=Streptomyces acidicola TaxID=2596892 RepID=UPI002AD45AD5|nr:DUF397 domain-containing protein [Streptomyces acidicola]